MPHSYLIVLWPFKMHWFVWWCFSDSLLLILCPSSMVLLWWHSSFTGLLCWVHPELSLHQVAYILKLTSEFTHCLADFQRLMIWEDHCLSDTSTLPGLTVVTKYLCLASATIQHIPLLSLQSRAYIWTQPSDFFFPVIGLGTLPVITVFTVPGIVSCQGGPAEEFFFSKFPKNQASLYSIYNRRLISLATPTEPAFPGEFPYN